MLGGGAGEACPVGEASREFRGGRNSDNASSELRRPVPERVWASWSVYRGGSIAMHTNLRLMAGLAWRYDAEI